MIARLNEKAPEFVPFELVLYFERQSEVDNFVDELTEPENDISSRFVSPIVQVLTPKTSVGLQVKKRIKKEETAKPSPALRKP
jgi:hypothetical protein